MDYHALKSINELLTIQPINDKSILIDISNEYVKKVKIGNFTICEIPNIKLIEIVKNIKNDIIFYINQDLFFILKNRKNYKIEIENNIKNIWFCKSITKSELEFNININITTGTIHTVPIIFARCQNSMKFLDKVHRKYIKTYKFKKNDIVAVKSVAGSGKTTTLLDLSILNKNKKYFILHLINV